MTPAFFLCFLCCHSASLLLKSNLSLEGMMLKLKLQYFAYLMRELTHWKRLWCWEGLGAGGEGDERGWDGWMASLTRWTWVWVNSGSWWWTGRPGVLRFMGSQRVGHDWATELNWTEPFCCFPILFPFPFFKYVLFPVLGLSHKLFLLTQGTAFIYTYTVLWLLLILHISA